MTRHNFQRLCYASETKSLKNMFINYFKISISKIHYSWRLAKKHKKIFYIFYFPVQFTAKKVLQLLETIDEMFNLF